MGHERSPASRGIALLGSPTPLECAGACRRAIGALDDSAMTVDGRQNQAHIND
jgi:hypothetical protein